MDPMLFQGLFMAGYVVATAGAGTGIFFGVRRILRSVKARREGVTREEPRVIVEDLAREPELADVKFSSVTLAVYTDAKKTVARRYEVKVGSRSRADIANFKTQLSSVKSGLIDSDVMSKVELTVKGSKGKYVLSFDDLTINRAQKLDLVRKVIQECVDRAATSGRTETETGILSLAVQQNVATWVAAVNTSTEVTFEPSVIDIKKPAAEVLSISDEVVSDEDSDEDSDDDDDVDVVTEETPRVRVEGDPLLVDESFDEV